MSAANQETGKPQQHAVVHTPGPWRQGGTTTLMLNQKCREIVSDDGKIGLVFGIEDADNKANAQLMAAAPELAALVRRAYLTLARPHWSVGESDGELSEHINDRMSDLFGNNWIK